MTHPTHTDERRTPASRLALKPGVYFHGLRYDLKEGRQWLAVGEDGHTYVVTFFEGRDGLRYGDCQCRAAEFRHLCKHVKRSAPADALLFKAQYERGEALRVNRAMGFWFYGN